MEHVPLLRIGPVLLAPIQTDLTDHKAEALQNGLLERIEKDNIGYVLLDIASLEMVDSFIIRILYDTAKMSQIMDARVVVVGMQPAVTLTLLEMGFDLEGLETAIDVEMGLERLGFTMLPLSKVNRGQSTEITDGCKNDG